MLLRTRQHAPNGVTYAKIHFPNQGLHFGLSRNVTKEDLYGAFLGQSPLPIFSAVSPIRNSKYILHIS